MVNRLFHLTPQQLGVAVAVAILLVVLLGGITHAILKDLGFGTALNGLFVMTGLAGGVLVRYLTFGFQ